ncbi:MAG: flagellin [Methanoregula sp.]|jgi:flagellar protein FlaG|uniref:flagellin n=1 Tax=Methanoregula sp. TaxID=2052170 RepID=UPI003C27F2AD
MSSDTFTTALFLITAVIAAGVLISAIFPVIYQMAGTFSSAGHASDQQLRTDFKVVLAVANSSGYAQVWMKNTGSVQISVSDIQRSDVICGDVVKGNFNRLSLLSQPGPLGQGQWTYTLSDLNNNNYWDPGETLEIDAFPTTLDTGGGPNYFQFTLPNGIWRSDQFTASVLS